MDDDDIMSTSCEEQLQAVRHVSKRSSSDSLEGLTD